MSGWMSYFGGGKSNPRDLARESIVNLRQTALTLEKKEEHLLDKIDKEEKAARANAATNKRAALAALRQKKAYEEQLDRISKQRLTLESQITALESANLNAETMLAMKKGADALKGIHQGLKVDKVDTIMDEIREQMDITNEISDAISNPVGMGNQVDEDELAEELEALEQEELNKRLVGADHVPVHTPASPQRVGEAPVRGRVQEEDDEEELRKLQAELAM